MKRVSKLPSDAEPVHNSGWSQVQWFMMMVSICRLYQVLTSSFHWCGSQLFTHLLRFLTSAVVMSRKNDAKELSLNLKGRVRWI